jgi:hypothetical protein
MGRNPHPYNPQRSAAQMVLVAARGNVGKGEHGEGQGRERPAREGKPCPLQALAQIVGARHVFKHAAARDLVPLLPGLAQAEQGVVRVEIDGHTNQEQRDAPDKPRREPRLAPAPDAPCTGYRRTGGRGAIPAGTCGGGPGTPFGCSCRAATEWTATARHAPSFPTNDPRTHSTRRSRGP